MSDSAFKRPPVHTFVECPNCRQLMEYGDASCPRCREEIDPEYAWTSAVVLHHNTQAIAVAKTISSFDALIPLVLIGLVFVLWYAWSVGPISWITFIWSGTPLAAIIVWFVRYGRFKIGDAEYQQARKDMIKSFCFWLAFLAVQILAMVFVRSMR